MVRHLGAKALASLLTAGLACASAAAFADPLDHTRTLPTVNDALLDSEFSKYVALHPGDWVGARDLVEELGGTMVISGDNGEVVTAEQATARFQALNGNGTEIETYAWPSLAFTANVAVVTSGPTDTTVSIAGAWNWKDSFIGQGSPVDIAAILVNKSCGTWSGYTSSTYKWNGTKTSGRSSLRSGGTGSTGPGWNIIDGVSNFENLVDNGTVAAVYNRSACSSTDKKNIQAEFVYEGNSGGSVLSVGLGWGGFSVSYSGSPNTQTRSSGSETVPY